MSKQQAIKMLVKRGWEFVRNDGKFLVVMRYPIYSDYPEKEGVFDPRDLLEEVLLREAHDGRSEANVSVDAVGNTVSALRPSSEPKMSAHAGSGRGFIAWTS